MNDQEAMEKGHWGQSIDYVGGQNIISLAVFRTRNFNDVREFDLMNGIGLPTSLLLTEKCDRVKNDYSNSVSKIQGILFNPQGCFTTFIRSVIPRLLT